jgi:hypothetical protein
MSIFIYGLPVVLEPFRDRHVLKNIGPIFISTNKFNCLTIHKLECRLLPRKRYHWPAAPTSTTAFRPITNASIIVGITKTIGDSYHQLVMRVSPMVGKNVGVDNYHRALRLTNRR